MDNKLRHPLTTPRLINKTRMTPFNQLSKQSKSWTKFLIKTKSPVNSLVANKANGPSIPHQAQ